MKMENDVKRRKKILRAQHETLDLTTEVCSELIEGEKEFRVWIHRYISVLYFLLLFLLLFLYWPFIYDTIRTLIVQQRMASMVRDKFSSNTFWVRHGAESRSRWYRRRRRKNGERCSRVSAFKSYARHDDDEFVYACKVGKRRVCNAWLFDDVPELAWRWFAFFIFFYTFFWLRFISTRQPITWVIKRSIKYLYYKYTQSHFMEPLIGYHILRSRLKLMCAPLFMIHLPVKKLQCLSNW